MRGPMRVRSFRGIAYGVSANPTDPTKITDEWGIDLSPNAPPPPSAKLAGNIGMLAVGGLFVWMLATGKFSGDKPGAVVNPAMMGLVDGKGSLYPLYFLLAGTAYYFMKKPKGDVYVPPTADTMASTIMRGERITMTRPK